MKRLLIGLTALMMGTAAVADESVLGQWSIGPNDDGLTAIIDIAACDGGICAEIVATDGFDAYPDEIDPTGEMVIDHMVPQPDGSFAGGGIYLPRFTRAVPGTLEVDGDRMVVEACFEAYCHVGEFTRVGVVGN